MNKQLKEEILRVLTEAGGKAMNPKQIYAKGEFVLDLNAKDLLPALEQLASEKLLIQADKGRFMIPMPAHSYTGKIEITRAGAGYLVMDEGEDIFIEQHNTQHAMHNDIVEVVVNKGHGRKQMQGKVVRIISRAKTNFTGIFVQKGNLNFVVPDDKRLSKDIIIPANTIKGTVGRDMKVIAEITGWPKGSGNPEGRILQILGAAGENETEMNAIVSEFGFASDFTDAVKAEADTFGTKISADDLKDREDYRKILTFTIDPETAKDFDDALSWRILDNGNYEIGVHIADVSHYVKPNTEIDKEAYVRATSVYLVDRVIPMLPHNLSDNLCSLVPQQDRLTFAVLFEIDADFKVVKYRFAKSVIYSDVRFSYEQAQDILEMKSEFPVVKGIDTKDVLAKLNEMAKHYQKLRFDHGSIAFESVEYRFVLDEKGKPIGLTTKVRKDTHKLIEEFMLMANKTVAQYVYGNKEQKGPRRPFIYRTHDSPAESKLLDLKNFASKWGYKIQIENDNVVRKSINELSKAIEGKPEQGVLQQMSIRSMAKAIYTTDHPSHFGLAFDYYSHFTSPIRRYPDLIAHRLLFAYINGRTMQEEVGWTESKLIDAAKHCSNMEQKASEAERASIKYKQAEYMQDHVGEVFDAVITGVTDFGIFAEIIENKCEGMIRLNSLKDDQYDFDSVNMQVTGRFSFKKYKLGDTVKVLVKAASALSRTIDLQMVESGSGFPKQKRSGGVRNGFRIDPKKKNRR
ncbi:MAG: ribonuclease R [Bacteroidia bacterium]|nr:ribonuclease R [Bacteroidia bacterium]